MKGMKTGKGEIGKKDDSMGLGVILGKSSNREIPSTSSWLRVAVSGVQG